MSVEFKILLYSYCLLLHQILRNEINVSSSQFFPIFWLQMGLKPLIFPLFIINYNPKFFFSIVESELSKKNNLNFKWPSRSKSRSNYDSRIPSPHPTNGVRESPGAQRIRHFITWMNFLEVLVLSSSVENLFRIALT